MNEPSRQMKVLIVEGNSAVRGVIRQLVTHPGVWIQDCVDGAHAIAAYAASRADFVIMNVDMKDMDGISVTRQIRVMDPAARIILVSDHDDEVLRERARDAGACGYVLNDNLLQIRELLTTLSNESDLQT